MFNSIVKQKLNLWPEPNRDQKLCPAPWTFQHDYLRLSLRQGFLTILGPVVLNLNHQSPVFEAQWLPHCIVNKLFIILDRVKQWHGCIILSTGVQGSLLAMVLEFCKEGSQAASRKCFAYNKKRTDELAGSRGSIRADVASWIKPLGRRG